MKKTALALVTDETAQLHKQFDDLLKKTNVQHPRDKDVTALRRLLNEHPKQELWRRIAGVMQLAENFALETSPLSPGLNECLRQGQKSMREQLGYDAAESYLEKLLITHASLCWLRLGFTEMQYANVMHGNNSLKLCEYYEKKLSAAQKRFTRACETLERVRRLAKRTPPLQFNIATEGGQQVNVAK